MPQRVDQCHQRPPGKELGRLDPAAQVIGMQLF
jgi:hypothetical protein